MVSVLRMTGQRKTALCLLLTASLLVFLHSRWSASRTADPFAGNHPRRLDGANLRRSGTTSSSSTTPDVCQLPDYDPFDATLLPYLSNFTLVCPAEPHLTYADQRGFLHLNFSGFEAANLPLANVHCTFSSIETTTERDTLLYGLDRTIWTKPVFMDAEYVSVKCKLFGELIYKKVHFYFPERKDARSAERSRELRKSGRLNVLLLQLDSMSRLSVLRTLPKSYDYLTGRLGAVVFRGMSKVEVNTHPNMLALLAGHKYRAGNPGRGTPVHRYGGGPVDRLPLVWRNFSAAGYLTQWADEMGEEGLFYLYDSGFSEPPVDYHPRALFLEMEAMGLQRTDLCFGNTPTHLFVLDYVDKFLAAMNDTAYFAYSIISRVSHDDPNFPQSIDDHLYKFMEKAFNTGQLNNTVFVVFGDHGLRFGGIRTTLIGGIEDKMPMLAVYLPEVLRKERPYLQASLEANSGELMGWFDMYEFLMDFAMDNLGERSVVPRWGRGVGSSPLRPLPGGRSCADAGIPRQYCPCFTAIDLPPAVVGVDTVARAALRLVDWANGVVLAARGVGRLCARLRLQRVEGAQLLARDRREVVTRGVVKLLRVTARAQPGDALLQGVVARSANDSRGQVIGNVERIDKYDNQSHCVASHRDQRLRMYCVCV